MGKLGWAAVMELDQQEREAASEWVAEHFCVNIWTTSDNVVAELRWSHDEGLWINETTGERMRSFSQMLWNIATEHQRENPDEGR